MTEDATLENGNVVFDSQTIDARTFKQSRRRKNLQAVSGLGALEVEETPKMRREDFFLGQT